MENKKQSPGMSISVKSFITAVVVIFVLMILTYGITLLLPCKGISFSNWLLSPFLVLGANGNGTLIAVIIFLLVIGAVFNALENGGFMQYMLSKITNRYQASGKYRLMYIIMFFFMAMGSLIGSFEECVPLVPIVVKIAIALGWDAFTGMYMSLLAVGCGFACGVFNPFTVGVAQGLAGLPMFSGVSMRLLSFVVVYLFLAVFVTLYARKVERKTDGLHGTAYFEKNPQMDKALKCFAFILGGAIIIVFSSSFLTFLQDYTMIIVALAFLVAGLVSSVVSGHKGKILCTSLKNGMIGMLPAVLMILMASSIKYTLEESEVLQIMIDGAISLAATLPKWAIVLFIYLIVLVFNFFIASGSAKAFLLIPLIVPLAETFGISPQLCILAYAFGDGFSNVFYPTNPALLISLGISDISYVDWAKKSFLFQIGNLAITSLLLLLGLVIGY